LPCGIELILSDRNQEIQNLLLSHGLRNTSVRRAVLSVLRAENRALTQNEILSALSGPIDRVTLYRTLLGFEESGLIHKVVDDDGTIRYALCRHEHTPAEKEEHPEDRHMHFRCVRCERILCLEDVHPPTIQLPKGFKMYQATFFIKGWCEECNSEGHRS
jgi:Fur family ferric uptake transcriptional regulator